MFDDIFSLLIVLAALPGFSATKFSGNSYQSVQRHGPHIGHHKLLSGGAQYAKDQNNEL